MAKAGFWLKGARGKLNGASISGTAGGGTVIRTITTPTNPKTEAQTETRSKFKLVSQLGATMKGVIAIKRDGALSGRNQFASINSANASYNMAGEATINLNSVQLTKSNVALGGFNADRAGNATIVKLNQSGADKLDRVCFIQFEKLDNGELYQKDSVVVSAAGADGLFQGELSKSDKAVVIYAYGMKDNSGAASEAFGNLQAPSAEQVAKLIVSSKIGSGDVTFTKTDGLTMLVGETEADSDDVEHFAVSLVISGNGSATGGGRFEAGQTATLRATPDAEAEFDGFYLNNAAGQLISTQNPYSFTVQEDVVICAKFHGGPVPHYNIGVSAFPPYSGDVTGGGSKAEGESCTVVATPHEGMIFDGWFENDQLVSNSASYTFTVERARTLVAQFAEAPESGFSNVRAGNTAFDRNLTMSFDDIANYQPLVGQYVSETPNLYAAVVGASAQVGQAIACPEGEYAPINNGSFSIAAPQYGTFTKLVVGTFSNNMITPEAIYEYTIEAVED